MTRKHGARAAAAAGLSRTHGINERPVARAAVELNYRVYKLPVFLRPRDHDGRLEGRHRTNSAESIVSDGDGGAVGETSRTGVCVCVLYAAVDVISEFDSLSVLPDLRQISQLLE